MSQFRKSRRPRLTPVYVALGAGDLAVEKLRELGAVAAGEAGANLGELHGRATGDVERVVRGARAVPALALNQAIDVVVRGQRTYEQLAGRGEEVVDRRVTPVLAPGEALLRQAGETVQRGREVADRTRDLAASTLRTVRDVEGVVDAVTTAAQGGRGRRGEVRFVDEQTVDTAERMASARRRHVATAAGGLSGAGVHPGALRQDPVTAGAGVEAGATFLAGRRRPYHLDEAAESVDSVVDEGSGSVPSFVGHS